ncbi:thioredoxin domain-containing protein [Reichenbachiella carrageenanivorans]|uniref:Thioredoxin domain-containing protein n=1 Tax=Reichenbachiella carrageenanivorans TaxID=2979869 RepID=A0ABY6D6J7_9BACT|nr:thioredoxin domain-containing protein [Reichenbachiella carrageenanivorans]UXX81240.1 thioredoxin domain-containing protein [Reichenbachiella carrageenanivorans]
MRTGLVSVLIIVLSTYACTQNMEKKHPHTNHLISETSPYLLQHAHNPVDWFPWGPEALDLAQREDKLMIISIGYAACHWCHVMEHESFEDSTIAAKMNANFLSIKVDREERPDIDQIYMTAAQLMTGQGGWPLNVIALPDGRPVFAGTYFPKENWGKVVDYFAEMYRTQPGKMLEQAEKITEGINQLEVPELNETGAPFDSALYASAGNQIIETIDKQYGGRQGAPKFPMPTIYDFLLTQHYYLPNEDLASGIKTTLDGMANGGIYDHLGGGFARYAVDETWTVPHFEKMLYDNAQLISLYSHAYQVYGDDKYAQAVRETITFCNRELSDPSGGYYSSLDADSEGEEGKFYVWSEEEIDQTLGGAAALFKKHYGVSKHGNFEGHNILERKESIADLANKYDLSNTEVKQQIEDSKTQLMKVRDRRIRPALDDKILTSWNGLMMIGLVDAYFALQDENYLADALETAQFIKDKQIQPSGQLLRNHKNGQSTISGFLDDYAFTILAFTKLYEATFDESWLTEAYKLKTYVDAHFSDEKTKMYFYTSDEDEKLIARKMELSDNVIPASNSAMTEALYLLGQFYYNQKDLDRAIQMVANMEKDIVANPAYYSNWSRLYGLMGQQHFEIAIVGTESHTKKMAIAQKYIPNKIMLGGQTEGELALLKGKLATGKTLIYVCENKSCLLPTEEVKKALSQLE